MATELKEKTYAGAETLAAGAEERGPVICFVCTGNTCRSPMAEAYMKSRGFEAFSRGLAAFEGEPISPLAVRALEDAGIEPAASGDYRRHRAKNMTECDMARADAVYCMTSQHAARLMFSCPQWAEKIHVLTPEISDPFGGNIEVYKKTLAEIISAIDEHYPEHE